MISVYKFHICVYFAYSLLIVVYFLNRLAKSTKTITNMLHSIHRLIVMGDEGIWFYLLACTRGPQIPAHWPLKLPYVTSPSYLMPHQDHNSRKYGWLFQSIIIILHPDYLTIKLILMWLNWDYCKIFMVSVIQFNVSCLWLCLNVSEEY